MYCLNERGCGTKRTETTKITFKPIIGKHRQAPESGQSNGFLKRNIPDSKHLRVEMALVFVEPSASERKTSFAFFFKFWLLFASIDLLSALSFCRNKESEIGRLVCQTTSCVCVFCLRRSVLLRFFSCVHMCVKKKNPHKEMLFTATALQISNANTDRRLWLFSTLRCGNRRAGSSDRMAKLGLSSLWSPSSCSLSFTFPTV